MMRRQKVVMEEEMVGGCNNNNKMMKTLLRPNMVFDFTASACIGRDSGMDGHGDRALRRWLERREASQARARATLCLVRRKRKADT
jgi:hypothetical protein